MQNNNKSCAIYFIFMIIFSSLFVTSSQVNWQGSGNMSASNMSQIWTYINGAIPNAISLNQIDAFSKNLSDHLNDIWHPAWNVYTILTAAGEDAVLYGYAFRDHWMWYNGYTIQNKIITFIIWKDYNCGTWNTVGSNNTVPTTFTNQEVTAIGQALGILQGQDNNDIWAAGLNFYQFLQWHSSFIQKEFSLVVSQNDASTSMYGRICSVSNNQFYSTISFRDGKNGKIHLFQTRVKEITMIGHP